MKQRFGGKIIWGACNRPFPQGSVGDGGVFSQVRHGSCPIHGFHAFQDGVCCLSGQARKDIGPDLLFREACFEQTTHRAFEIPFREFPIEELMQGHVGCLKAEPYGFETGTPEEIRRFRGQFFHVERVGSVEPKPEVPSHDLLEHGPQVFFKTHKKGIVIKSKIHYAVLPVPVKEFMDNLAGIPCGEPGVQKMARTVFTAERAPG